MSKTSMQAFKIFAELIKGEVINPDNHEDLLELYELNTSVLADLDEMLEMINCSAYQGNDRGVYISPSIDNKYFGYSNEELKKILSVKDNANLYMCYFIMSTIVTMYYKDDSALTGKEYLNVVEVEEEVSKRISILKDTLVKETVSKEMLDNEEGYNSLINIWQDQLQYATDYTGKKDFSNQISGQAKISYINRVFKFMEEQKLVKYFDKLESYHRTERLKTMVYQVYKESKNIEFINNMILDLNEENGGEYDTI